MSWVVVKLGGARRASSVAIDIEAYEDDEGPPTSTASEKQPLQVSRKISFTLTATDTASRGSQVGNDEDLHTSGASKNSAIPRKTKLSVFYPDGTNQASEKSRETSKPDSPDEYYDGSNVSTNF